MEKNKIDYQLFAGRNVSESKNYVNDRQKIIGLTKLFTQDELDAIISKRVNRVEEKNKLKFERLEEKLRLTIQELEQLSQYKLKFEKEKKIFNYLSKIGLSVEFTEILSNFELEQSFKEADKLKQILENTQIAKSK